MRHKRQALQDMARPLKQWLYKHRDNPYPTKTEKILLALGSQMTLVQVRQPQPLPPTAALGRCTYGEGDRDSVSQSSSGSRARGSSEEVLTQPARPRVLCASFPLPSPRLSL